MTPTALVTGDLGFVGHHMSDALVQRGYRVEGCDTIRSANTHYNDLWRDCRFRFERDTTQYDLVVHCAAVVGGRRTIDGNPLATAESIELDTAYARWLVRTRPIHAVYVSSSAVYPTDLQSGVDVVGIGLERSLPADYRLREIDQNALAPRIGTPDQVYGWSKLVGELLMHRVAAAGVPVTIVRPFSGYGSDQSLDYPFRSFVRRATERHEPFEIWGDGQQVRDFIHINDVVAGTLALVERDAARFDETGFETPVRPVNLCTGVATSFDQLKQLVCTSMGYAPSVRYVGDAPTGVSYRVGDPTAFNEVYTPKISLRQGVERALTYDEIVLRQTFGV